MRGKNLHVSARKEHLLLSIATHISCKCEFCGMPVRHDFTLYLERSANIVFLHMIKNSYVVATFVEGMHIRGEGSEKIRLPVMSELACHDDANESMAGHEVPPRGSDTD